jgi:two-component system sensor histidine kinase KdpD
VSAGHRRSLAAALALWIGLALASTLAMRPWREDLKEAHVALVYMVLVLVGSARDGRTAGLVLSVVCFLLFNFFLLEPVHTLAIADALDWWILLAFLITGGVAAELLHRAQRVADLAERRAEQIERLAAEAQHVDNLREADRLKDALLASVSHDLRTPLTSIRATAAEIREAGHESAAIIEEEAERLNRFVSDLLDLSRIRAGALPITTEINAAEDLIGTALLETRGIPGSDRIEVTPLVGPIVPVGRFDFVHALRALVNLLENALRYSPAPETVELELLLEEGTLAFVVRDRGPGIDPRDRDRIFEPFFRGAAERPRSQGSGLGLAIARSIARAQGGEVSHEERDGGGSVFTLRLPREHLPPIS